jgi:hypothetical protein
LRFQRYADSRVQLLHPRDPIITIADGWILQRTTNRNNHQTSNCAII